MGLQGKIITIGQTYCFEYITAEYNRPVQVRQVWEIVNPMVRGMSYANPADAIGRQAVLNYGKVSCYLNNGNYFEGNLPQLGETKACIQQSSAIAPPKVRAGFESYWQDGRWQKRRKATEQVIRDPGEDAADRWNETHGDRF